MEKKNYKSQERLIMFFLKGRYNCGDFPNP